MKKKTYWEHGDLEKIAKQWHKLTGLHGRDEWSAAIVRAATAAEIAANFAIRKEFESRSKFDTKFLDSLLLWANGLNGKMQKLLLPLGEQEKEDNKFKGLSKIAKSINEKRNSIVHRGEFCNEKEATKLIDDTKRFIETIVKLYEPTFELKSKKVI